MFPDEETEWRHPRGIPFSVPSGFSPVEVELTEMDA